MEELTDVKKVLRLENFHLLKKEFFCYINKKLDVDLLKGLSNDVMGKKPGIARQRNPGQAIGEAWDATLHHFLVTRKSHNILGAVKIFLRCQTRSLPVCAARSPGNLKMEVRMHKQNLKILKKSWPSALVARSEIREFSGGLVSPKTLANLDSRGVGPRKRFRVGRKICYPIRELIAWLESKTVILNDPGVSSGGK